jgi:hypothetical protein
MKLAFFFINVLVWTFVFQLFMPWWIIGVISFVLAYLMEKNKFIAFASCMVAVFSLWVGTAYWADGNFDRPVSDILSSLLGNISPSAVYFLTGIIGGIVAGLGGCLGTWTRSLSAKIQGNT